MFTLHCTQKLRDRLKRPLTDRPQPPSTALGNWYATAWFRRPQLALLVNERTLLPVLMPLAPAVSLPDRAGQAIALALARHGVDPSFIARAAAAMNDVEIAKTINRRVVGTMNEFVFEAGAYREHAGFDNPIALALRLAQTPCSVIGYDSQADLLQQIAAQR